MQNIHKAIKPLLDTKTYTNSAVPQAYSGANVVSGGTTGNVIVNANYQFNCKLVKIDDNTIYCYNRLGEDIANFNTVVTPMLGSIVKRVFDVPSKSWSSSDIVIYNAPTQWSIQSFKVHVVDGSIWIYATKFVRANYPSANGCVNVLFKSTDGLIGESFTETSIGFDGQFLDIWFLGTAQNGSKFLIVANGAPTLQMLRSTDGGNTFTQDLSVNFNTGTTYITEGQFIQLQETPNVIIGVLRDNKNNYLLEQVSNDYGLTWSNPIISTGLGASGGNKVTPKIIRAANNPASVVLYFNDRGTGNRSCMSGITSIANFKANVHNPVYLLGTGYSQGNGDFLCIDEKKQLYLVVTYLAYPNASGVPSPSNTNTIWFLFQDNYTKSLSPTPYQ